MPRIQLDVPQLDDVRRNRLVKSLATELASSAGSAAKQPLIYEEAVPETKTIHVLVVWEAWRDVPSELRGSIILDAYGQALPAVLPSVTIALGITVAEGVEMNLLPYQIVTTRKNSDPVSLEQLADAMKQEGAVQTPSGLLLALPTRKMAEDVHARLSGRIPGPYWAIQRTLAAIDD